MKFTIQAACGCNMGKIRKNNEDNFLFDGKCLEEKNEGLRNPVWIEDTLKNGFCVAVFDGMGGEQFGECASYAAARQMQEAQRSLADYFVSERKYLLRLTDQLHRVVLEEQNKMQTEHMGTTMVALYFSGHSVYVCNVGDSRAYRLREGEFLQLSQDHVEKRPGREGSKAPLTQHLGFGGGEIELEPYIAKGKIKAGDIYLLCSDGVTDMLTNFEIADILLTQQDPEACVQELIRAACEKGGKDNITAIVCKLG